MNELFEKFKERRSVESKLEREQEHILDEINNLDVTSEEYQNAIACLDHLSKSKETETRKKVSGDTVLILIAQGLSLFGVMWFTKKDLLPRDAMPFFHKIKGRL